MGGLPVLEEKRWKRSRWVWGEGREKELGGLEREMILYTYNYMRRIKYSLPQLYLKQSECTHSVSNRV